jgi:hypothetical protein
MKEVATANQYLTKLEHLPASVTALAKNRQSLGKAISHCTGIYDRMMKNYGVIPSASAVASILASPLEGTQLPTTHTHIRCIVYLFTVYLQDVLRTAVNFLAVNFLARPVLSEHSFIAQGET